MACACKLNQRLSEIQKTYGVNNKQTVKTDIIGKFRIFVKKVLLFTLCIPFIPAIALFVAFRGIFVKKPISIRKIFKIG